MCTLSLMDKALTVRALSDGLRAWLLKLITPIRRLLDGRCGSGLFTTFYSMTHDQIKALAHARMGAHWVNTADAVQQKNGRFPCVSWNKILMLKYLCLL